jgi:hypothetical protein
MLLLILVSCSSYNIPKTIDEIPDVAADGTLKSPVIVEAPKVVEIMSPKTRVELVSLTGFSKSQEERFKKILTNVEVVLNSDEFKKAILNHTWEGKKQFVDTTDTNQQVLDKILSKYWKVEYRLEYIKKKLFVPLTVGYTLPSVSWIVINSKIFDDYDDELIANNIFHEYGGHKLGRYSHSKKRNKTREYSVPYAVGNIAEKIYRKMFMTK